VANSLTATITTNPLSPEKKPIWQGDPQFYHIQMVVQRQ